MNLSYRKEQILNTIIMDETSRDLIVSIVALASLFGIIYVFLMTRYKIRKAMIEKGVDPTLFSGKNIKSFSYSLKFGMLMVGTSIGLLLGYVISDQFGYDATVSILSMVFLWGGIGLIANYFVERKLNS